jgi:hypothetical protein
MMTTDPWQGMTREEAWARYNNAEQDRQEAWRRYYAQQGLELQRQQVESSRSNTNLVVLLLFLVPSLAAVIYMIVRVLTN